MSKRVRRKFTSEEKVGLIRLHLIEHKPVSEICDEHQLNVNQFYTWQKLFFENGSAAFNVGKTPKHDPRDKIINRDEGIAELMMEHVKFKKKVWPELKNSWVEPDIRDEVVDFVNYWTERFSCITAKLIISFLNIYQARFHQWRKRYGTVNRHNGNIPRHHWLFQDEKDAIIRFYLNHQTDGYRRCAYMMIDQDVACCSPSTVYRVLSESDTIRRWNRKPSKKGNGFEQPLKPHEHWHKTIKAECIRPGCALNIADARRLVKNYVKDYNEVRLHSAIGYIAPKDKLEGRAEIIHSERDRKLEQGRLDRIKLSKATRTYKVAI